MGGNIYPVIVQWGDCDPAGIVFYPNFFAYFDRASWALFGAAGITHEVMQNQYGCLGIPLVDAQATFKRPCRFGERLDISSRVEEWKHRVFTVQHVIHVAGEIAVTGQEIRIWGTRHPDDPPRLRAAPVPPDVIEKLEGLQAAPAQG